MPPRAPRDPLVDDEWLDNYRRVRDLMYMDEHGSSRGAQSRLAAALGITTGTLSRLPSQGSAWLVFRISRHLRIAPPRAILDEAQYALLEELEAFRMLVSTLAKGKPDGLSLEKEESAILVRRFRAIAKRATEDVLGLTSQDEGVWKPRKPL